MPQNFEKRSPMCQHVKRLPLSEYDKEYTECRAVATNVDILTCEIEGIVLCLELVNRYFNEGGKSGNSESVFILNDCTVEIVT